jgi:hypothetical protein
VKERLAIVKALNSNESADLYLAMDLDLREEWVQSELA